MTTAVIPVHNRVDLLARLLDSIGRQTVPFDEVIVVDNLSTDGARQLAADRGCRVIEMSENTGFARAVNAGWRSASTPLIGILNSDVELDPCWLEQLQSGIGDRAFATGLIIDSADRGSIDGTYDLVSRGGCAWRVGNGQPIQTAPMRCSISIAPGTACIYRRDVLELLNGFDESFGSYLEDVDLGLRCLRHEIGGVYLPEAVAWHKGSATFGKWNAQVIRMISRNQVRLVARHYDRDLLRTCFWQIVAGQLLWGLVATRHGGGMAWLAGKVDGLKDFRIEGQSSRRLRDFLEASEREIRTRSTDAYWRWYFRLLPEASSAAN